MDEVLEDLGIVQPLIHHSRYLTLGHSFIRQAGNRLADVKQFCSTPTCKLFFYKDRKKNSRGLWLGIARKVRTTG